MHKEKQPTVYILTNKPRGVLYTGVTSDLIQRVWQHKTKQHKGFTSQYNAMRLVYYEQYQQIGDAIVREKNLKNWLRAWKIELIEKDNPDWIDLYSGMVE